jgi:hypothetical protein
MWLRQWRAAWDDTGGKQAEGCGKEKSWDHGVVLCVVIAWVARLGK